jgi:dephospho-CoA kinase
MAGRFLLGLTGNIACGKSTVLEMLAARGAATIDADRVYHELIVADSPLWAALVQRFGPAIVRPDRSIDRRALAGIVFNDPVALADLDRITHPPVVAELRRRLDRSYGPLVVVDAVKLVESGFAAECDAVWVVTCRPEQQVARLRARNGMTEQEAAERVAAQPALNVKLDRADVVIANDGSLAATEEQVERALRTLVASTDD